MDFEVHSCASLPVSLYGELIKDVGDPAQSLSRAVLKTWGLIDNGISAPFKPIAEKSQVIFAKEDGKVCGWLFAVWDEQEGNHLLNFFVRDPYRKQGIGSKMNQEAHSLLEGQCVYQVWPKRYHGIAGKVAA